MEKAAVEAMLVTIFEAMDPDVEYELRHPDFQADMPQSGERFREPRSAAGDAARLPEPPTITLRRVVGEGDVWVAEATSDYGERRFHTVVILEMEGDLILRETRYYTEPFEAPEWRAAWVESIPER